MRKRRVRDIPVVKPSPGPEEAWVREVFGKPMHPDRPYTAEDARREGDRAARRAGIRSKKTP